MLPADTIKGGGDEADVVCVAQEVLGEAHEDLEEEDDHVEEEVQDVVDLGVVPGVVVGGGEGLVVEGYA